MAWSGYEEIRADPVKIEIHFREFVIAEQFDKSHVPVLRDCEVLITSETLPTAECGAA
jgi:hypothetical protein